MHDPGDEDAPPVARIEEPRPPADWFLVNIKRSANALACRLGGPVYLVGSALDVLNPADFDVRVLLREADLLRLFGKSMMRNGDWTDWTERDVRMGREQLKQSRRLSRRLRCNVDFQIQSEVDFKRYEGRPRLRLDTVPLETFEVGFGDA